MIHHGGNIMYVGQTGSPSMSFGIRLRREFQESASNGRHIYPKLATLIVPPAVMVAFFSAKEIDKLVYTDGVSFNGFEKIEIFEIAAIHAFKPEFQRHHEKRLRKEFRKLNISEQTSDAMLECLKPPR